MQHLLMSNLLVNHFVQLRLIECCAFGGGYKTEATSQLKSVWWCNLMRGDLYGMVVYRNTDVHIIQHVIIEG